MGSLNVAQMQHVRALFDALDQVPRGEWESRLAEATEDADVIAQTLALLRARNDTSSVIQRRLDAMLSEAVDAELDEGDRLGPWLLIEKIASGGMGTVFRAKRADGLYEREVAIKLMHGISDPDTLERLRQERQILARMRLPNVAQLYDGGTTPRGNPYIVMEFVHGRALNEFLRDANLPLGRTADLFLGICSTVQKAHEQLIVHCDLKPDNILVDADGQAKLLDFGVAHLIDGAANAKQGSYVTPAYAAPETLEGSPIAVTMDVYSLGVILREMLGGRLMDADLRAITSRAAAPAREDRYPTVAAFAADLQNWRQHRPVIARKGGRGYVAGRFLRRHWKSAALSLAAVIVTAVFMVNLISARTSAEREARSSREISNYLIGMFVSTDPARRGEAAEIPLTARELLDGAALRLKGDLRQSPGLRARLQAALGQAYQNLGIASASQRLLTEAAATLQEERGTNGEDAALVQAALSMEKTLNGDGQSGLREAERGVALLKEREDTFVVATLHHAMAFAYLNLQQYPEADRELTLADTALAALPPSEAKDLRFKVAGNRALLYWRWGRLQEAESAYRQLIRGTPQTALSTQHDLETRLAQVLRAQGKLQESRALLESGMSRAIALYGEDSRNVVLQMESLADLYSDMGDYIKAERQMAVLRERIRRVEGPNSLRESMALFNEADLRHRRGDDAAAERLFREAVALRTRLVGAQSPMTLRAETGLARYLIHHGKNEEGGRRLANAAEGLARTLPSDAPARFEVALARVDLLIAARQFEQASSVLAPYRNLDHGVNDSLAIIDAEARLLFAQGLRAEVIRKWKEGLQLAHRKFGDANTETAKWRLHVAIAQDASGEKSAARETLRPALPVLRAQMVANSVELRAADRIATGHP